MTEIAYVTWLIERAVARGALRIGVVAGRVVAELAGKRLALPNTDILSLADIAAARATAAMARTLREGGYAHLLGGQVALLPGEARMLREAALGTAEGLALRRAKLVEALEKARAADVQPSSDPGGNTGLAHHADGREAHISEARLALNAFDRAHPHVLASARKPQADGCVGS